MLLQMEPDAGKIVRTFDQLFEITSDMLEQYPGNNRTIVLGPVISNDPAEAEDNWAWLSQHAINLSARDWVVLDLASYQEAFKTLIERQNIKGYPHEVFEDFIIPLLQSGLIQTVFVRDCVEKSLGATLGLDVAHENKLQVVYITP
jgi:hypothetical protein